MHCSCFLVELEGYLLACSQEKTKRKLLLPGCPPAVKGFSCEEAPHTAGLFGQKPRCEGHTVAMAVLKEAMGEDGEVLL